MPHDGALVQLFPEILRGLDRLDTEAFQSRLVLGQHYWTTSGFETLFISLQNDFATLFQANVQIAQIVDDLDARRQAHQVAGIRQRIGLVEIVNTPRHPAFGIAPRAETVNVEIADAEDLRSVQQIVAYFRPQLGPA